MLPEVMEVVVGRRFARAPARLAGWRRLRLRDAVYPAVVPAAGETTAGVLWHGLDRAALTRIDRFEGALYERPLLRVALVDGVECEAFVYVLRAAEQARASDTPWDEADFRARHLRAYLSACRAFAREEP